MPSASLPPVIHQSTASLEERLEQGELVLFPECPFALPETEDRQFLLQQKLRELTHKNISYDPIRNRVKGFQRSSPEQEDRLRGLLAAYSRTAMEWLENALPRYRGGCQRDRASFRSEEEATRRLRHSARNDLLHIDAFPNRPARGRRILRLWTNLHPSEPRVWVTSDLLSQVLERYGPRLGVPQPEQASWLGGLGRGLLRLVLPGRVRRSPYDSFMLRIHNALKQSDEFQERCPKRLWVFPPGSTWMLFTDARTHAELRGQFALEHSFFIEPRSLVCPDCSPLALMQGRIEKPLPRAA